MKKMIAPIAVIGGIVVLLIAYGGCKYNSLVSAEEDVDGAWAQVENVLKRRADLIPNLVETVKGFAAQEKEVFSNIADARSRLLGAKGPAEAAEANAGLTSALGRLLVISEQYPQLKSNENFIRLQDELAGTENRIATERMRYNDQVKGYNKTIRQFPGSIFAGMFGFDKKEYFEVAEADKQVPQVKF
jgi:LemA protein